MVFDQSEKDIICPKCQDTDIQNAYHAYKNLQSKNTGRKLFTAKPIQKDTPIIDPKKKEKLINKLTPPREPYIGLPAGTIAIMAFTISWLATGSVIIGWIGQTAYFIISVFVIVFMGTCFYSTIKIVIRNYRKAMEKYKKLRVEYNKKFICSNCHHIFIGK